MAHGATDDIEDIICMRKKFHYILLVEDELAMRSIRRRAIMKNEGDDYRLCY